MTQPLSPEREREIRALDFLDLIRDNDERTAAQTAVSAVCALLNEVDRLRSALAAAAPNVTVNGITVADAVARSKEK